MPIDLSICVLTYEGEQLLPECLSAILRAAEDLPCRWELVVVDNGSSQPVRCLPPARVVRHPTNVGNIAGMNLCFTAATGCWVLFVANDVRLDPGALGELWRYRSYCNVLQPVLWQPDKEIDNVGISWLWPGYGFRVRQVRPSTVVDAFAATCFLIHKPLWRSVGPFDSQLGLSHEDIDWSLRLKRLVGGDCRFVPSAHATHLMGQTIGRVTRGALSPQYHRARLRIIEKHYRGLDGWLRRSLIRLLDGLVARGRRR